MSSHSNKPFSWDDIETPFETRSRSNAPVARVSSDSTFLRATLPLLEKYPPFGIPEADSTRAEGFRAQSSSTILQLTEQVERTEADARTRTRLTELEKKLNEVNEAANRRVREAEEMASQKLKEVEELANVKLREMKETLVETKERALRSEQREAEAHQRLKEAYELVKAATERADRLQARIDHLQGI
ncbi:hypothetical protein BDW22DRAFT_1483542 [Trametopsis cervina]|nr:hypothetical protein BDW22DRAFT_1483542 [Trametopsis cervina]